MLQSSVQQTYNLQIIHRIRTETTYNELLKVCAFDILAAIMFAEDCFLPLLSVSEKLTINLLVENLKL